IATLNSLWRCLIFIDKFRSLIKDSAGKLVGYLYAFRDISPLKKVVGDLEISRAKLAERNAELDLAIEELKMTQGQLLQAQKMESLGTLAGEVLRMILIIS
ncbi:MAG: hypothetical protein QME44_11215, partial [Thermodesulfobacteriota bacterium]|nr:hypothetical protein [Thermodesulfobacteriota bacterium]